jgi:short-subunit dehydrogenase
VNQKLEDIKENCGRIIQTKAVIADLSKCTTISDYEKLGDEMNDIDIAMLILNAGVAQWYPFAEATNELIEQMVVVNALHPVYLAKVLLNRMLAR